VSATSGHDEWQSGSPTRLETHGGFGGLYSTLDDMLIWSRALESDKLLSPAWRQAMFTDYGHNYGFGWRFANKFGRKLVWHTGNDQDAGFASILDRFPEEGLTVVVLTNYIGLTNSTAMLTVGGKSTTFPATATREGVERVESLYFIGKAR
jgi:CubicO group peptidase (beta-lactamase class C family)